MSGQQSRSNGISSNIANMMSSGAANNQFSQNVYGGQQSALADLYRQAQGLFTSGQSPLNQGIAKSGQNIDWVNGQVANNWENQLGGGQFGNVNTGSLVDSYQRQLGTDTTGAYGRLAGSLDKSLNTQFTPSGPSNQSQIYAQMMGGQGNNYADAMKSQYLSDAQRAQEQMMSNLDARIGGTGMTGSTRHGIAQGMGMRDINQNLQRNLAETGYNTFDKDLQNKLSIAQQADANNFNRENMYLQDRQNAQGLAAQELAAQRGLVSGAQQGMAGLNQAGQDTRNLALSQAQGMQNLGMGNLAPLSQQWSGLQNYQNAIGGPLVLNSGTGSSWNNAYGSQIGGSSMNSKSGGGGI
jgi:hypothetical protein